MSTASDMREFTDFLRRVCRALMECGCSSNRVEVLTQKLGASWGFEVEALAIPTGVWISVRRGTENIVELSRIHSWSVDLDKLARINLLVDSFHDHRVSVHDACALLTKEVQAKPPYGVGITLLAGALSSPILIFGYGGSALEIALAFPMGIVAQLLGKYVFVGDTRRYLGDFLPAAFAAAYATACHRLYPETDVPRLIVGGLVALVPGLTLVNAVHEVAQKNLVSGAAKLLEAMVITASLGLGVAFVLGAVLYFGL